MSYINRKYAFVLIYSVIISFIISTASGSTAESFTQTKRESIKLLQLQTPSYKLKLDFSNGLHAVSLDNSNTKDTLMLGSHPDLEVDIDSAYKRIWIEGWRATQSPSDASLPDKETGYQSGYYKPELDDSAWTTAIAPNLLGYGLPEETWFWTRTHLFIPDDCSGKDLTLHLGSTGVSDFRYMRVFVNGVQSGTRRADGRWFEPLKIVFKPGSDAYRYLRFGQDNVIALQLKSPIWRTDYLDSMDPEGIHSFPWPGACTAPFEQQLVVETPYDTPALKVVSKTLNEKDGLIKVGMASADKRLSASVTYRSTHGGKIIVKSTSIKNESMSPLRIMNIHLGTYQTGMSVTDGEMGFPVYIDGQFFASLAHPAGWSTGENGIVKLRQYPGIMLSPGETFQCMDAVYGVSERGKAQDLFVDYLKQNMRRTIRRHDKPYAILEFFGGWEYEGFLNTDLTEKYCLEIAEAMKEYGEQTGQQFDLSSLEFWCDPNGDFTRFKPQGFPEGFNKLRDTFLGMGVSPGLWIDSASGGWGIGSNPVIAPCRTNNLAYGGSTQLSDHVFCRAEDPFKSMFTNGFVYHARENRARLFKFDNLRSVCYNIKHCHFPGFYSIEPIYNAAIDTFISLDKVSPDVFLMLYWGYRSPWWLLHGDTIFESGINMEAATPSPMPSLYARDGVSISLDQSKVYAKDLPALGKDSLGVWLSSWGWNSCIGKERWQEGIVMDMCRGTLLLQPWTDSTWLTIPERAQFGEFAKILRENPEYFTNPRLVLGDPWKNEPYGYACTDGQRGFIAVNNCSWSDRNAELKLDSSWGLDAGRSYHLYRLYPEPAQLSGNSEQFKGSAEIWLRPFDVALFELVPVGGKPSIVQEYIKQMIQPYVESSIDIPLTSTRGELDQAPEPILLSDQRTAGHIIWPVQPLVVTGNTPATKSGGQLVVTASVSTEGKAVKLHNLGRNFGIKGKMNNSEIMPQPVLGLITYPSCWQAWRINIPASTENLPLVFNVNAAFSDKCPIKFDAHFIPNK
ncbi:MAG: alpha-galactosidase [Armatimonadota bacterium]